tara:strand:- start:297 stop:647 length:351 start_codon:yes stop_codon:yes gene_type:complete
MTKVTLYHANWCGHCKNFKPTWDGLKSFFQENNIEFAEYEDTANPKEIEDAKVEGFPTIRITKDNNEYDYFGERTADAIISEVLPNLQIGGNDESLYKEKYLKYKNKYLKLKLSLN